MKRFTLLALSVLLLASISVAQDKKNKGKRFAFSYNYGPSSPQGNFKQTNSTELPLSRYTGQDTNKLSGYALAGFHFDIYCTYKVWHHLSVMVALYEDQSNYNMKILNSQYDQIFPKTDVTIATGDNFYLIQYFAGPYLEIPIIKDHLSFSLKALAGYSTDNYPAVYYLGLTQTTLYSYSPGTGFGYSAGASIKYLIDVEGIIGAGLQLNVNYSGTTISYPNYSITNYTNGTTGAFLGSSTFNAPKTMNLGVLQVTLGFSFEI